jgi:uncharacterized protein (DUF2141 family)
LIAVRILLLAVLASASIGAAPAPTGELQVQISNVRNAKGRVHIDVCPEALFLKDNCPYSGNAPARTGMTIVIARGIPAGRYAVQAFHDENSNGEVDRALFGIPKEGVGFSNDARIGLGPPKFADAVFAFDGNGKAIQLKMRYFLGPSGPQAR